MKDQKITDPTTFNSFQEFKDAQTIPFHHSTTFFLKDGRIFDLCPDYNFIDDEEETDGDLIITLKGYEDEIFLKADEIQQITIYPIN